MKLMKKYFILAAVALTMAACSNDDGANIANDGTIRITTDLGKAGTRTIDQTVQATQIANGGSVWVEFTTNATTIDQGDGSTGDGDGKWNGSKKASAAYTADGSGNLSSTSPTKWPYSGANATSPETVSIEAWAPFSSAPTINTTTIETKDDQTTEANYTASDYLYGKRSSFAWATIASPVLVTFDHKLAKINVNVSNSDGSSVTGAKVVFGPNTLDREATLKANGVVDATGGSAAGAITMATALDANATASCIIIPQTINAGAALFTITLGSTTYTCTATAAKTYDPTKVYTYNLSLSDGKTIVLSEQINDWTDAGTESVIANQNP